MYCLCSLYLLLNQTPQIFAGMPQISCGTQIAKNLKIIE
jgi:hypothetical protein